MAVCDGAIVNVEVAPALDFVDAVADDVRAVLGGRLAALYVVGSLASGDATGPASDIDVVVVASERIDGPEADHLAQSVVAGAQDCPWAGLELVVYAREVLRRPRHPLRYELNVNAGGARPTHVSTGGDPPHWFLLDVAMARDHAIPRVGPPAPTVIGQPIRRDVSAAIRESLAWHARHEATSPNAVLNACRSWCFMATGTWESKSAAAAWALDVAGAPPVVAAAAAARATGARTALPAADVANVLATVDRVAARWA